MTATFIAIIGGLWTLAAIFVGHRLSRTSQVSDRLRLTYVDFLTAIQSMNAAKGKLEGLLEYIKVDLSGKQAADDSAPTSIDRASGEYSAAATQLFRAKQILLLLETESQYLEHVEKLDDKANEMGAVHGLNVQVKLASEVGELSRSLVTLLRTKHPLLRCTSPMQSFKLYRPSVTKATPAAERDVRNVVA